MLLDADPGFEPEAKLAAAIAAMPAGIAYSYRCNLSYRAKDFSDERYMAARITLRLLEFDVDEIERLLPKLTENELEVLSETLENIPNYIVA